MEDRYQLLTGLSFGKFVAGYAATSNNRRVWRPLLSKAVLGLVMACLAPQTDLAQAQSGSVNPPAAAQSSLGNLSKAAEVDASWIWSPTMDASSTADQGEVYFRKKFTLVKPEKAELVLAAGDEFELFINGELIANGHSYGAVTKFDPMPFLESGTNLIAVRVKHLDSEHVGLALKMRIKESGEVRYRVLRTDSTWRSYTAKAYQWYKSGFNAKSWLTSKTINMGAGSNSTAQQVAVFGGAAKMNRVGGSLAVESNEKAFVAPLKSRVKLSSMSNVAIPAKPERAVMPTATAQNLVAPRVGDISSQSSTSGVSTPNFVPATIGEMDNVPPVPPTEIPDAKVAKKAAPKVSMKKSAVVPLGLESNSEFSVTTVLNSQQSGSVIAMEFNEYGQLLMSREGGPLMIADLVTPTGADSGKKQVRVFCNEVNSCQGILPLNGDVFVTGEGPEGQGLYRLSDKDGNGQAEVEDTLLTFTGELGGHGPHGVTLGLDGMLYVVVGNESQLKGAVSRRSPYQFTYEGSLQAGGRDSLEQGENSLAPGGTVVRVGVDGSRPETFAGGIRNAYDLVFDQNGELFIHDSEVEADRSTTWYRPTSVYNVTAGAEMGWRRGWSKFASYYLDQSPTVCRTGTGHPTGAALYQHLTFPKKYQNTLFFADWDEGEILTVKTKPAGAGFVGQAETFLKGRSLKVSDLAVGPSGDLYFSNGGSGNSGGIYKVSWNGEVPQEVVTFKNDLEKVMRHPQPNSAWARQNIAELRRQMGEEWKASILGVVTETRNQPEFRLRAMQLSVLYGPTLPHRILKTLAEEKSAIIRLQTALMCGLSLRADDNELLIGLLNDPSSMVRRKACEALLRADLQLKPTLLTHLLKSSDASESATARRLLERIDAGQWQAEMVNSKDIRLFVNSSLALMTAQPSLERAYSVLAEGSLALDGFLSDEDFLDLLRVIEVTLSQGKVEPAKIPAFVQRIGEEFPAGSPEINMELVKVLSGLNAGELDGRLATWLQAPTTSKAEKFQAVTYFRRSSNTFSSSTQNALAQAMAELKGYPGFQPYTMQPAIAADKPALDPRNASLKDIIDGGDKWPEAVVESFYQMPNPLTDELADSLKTLDQKLMGREDQAAKRVRLGIIALLAQHGSEASFAWLRESYDKEPTRRADLAIGLALDPGKENWSYLVSSLPIVDEETGKEILKQLVTVRRRPKNPIHYRDAIELGYRLQGDSTAAADLLAHWTGTEVGGDSWQQQMNAWNQWYAAEYPSAAPAAKYEAAEAGFETVADQEAIINTSIDSGGTFVR